MHSIEIVDRYLELSFIAVDGLLCPSFRKILKNIIVAHICKLKEPEFKYKNIKCTVHFKTNFHCFLYICRI